MTDLPDLGAVPRRRTASSTSTRQLHRLQGVHERLPLRRDLHRPETRPPRTKCNFCAHRSRWARAVVRGGVPDPVDQGGRPGRPHRPVNRRSSPATTSVRAPEQGTNPSCSTKRCRPGVARPARTAIAADGMIWADTTPSHRRCPTSRSPHGVGVRPHHLHHGALDDLEGEGVGVPRHQGDRRWGHGRRAARAARPRRRAGRRRGRPAGPRPGCSSASPGCCWSGPQTAHAVLVHADPRQHWSSWLVKGAVRPDAVLDRVCSVWFLAGLLEADGHAEGGWPLPAVLGAAATAGYTAFLFASARAATCGRPRCCCRCCWPRRSAAGGATYALMDLFMDVPEPTAIRWVLLGGVAAIAALMAIELVGEVQPDVEAGHLRDDPRHLAQRFWSGRRPRVVVPAAAVIVALAGVDTGPALAAVAALSALVGLRYRGRLRPCRPVRAAVLTRVGRSR
jgi:hypothetical protein